MTELSLNGGTNELEYTDETGTVNSVDLSSLFSSASDTNTASNVNVIATHTSGDGTVTNIEETVTELSLNGGTNELEYTDENGTVNSVDLSSLFSSANDTNTASNVNVIATHTSGDGTVTNIEETVTTLVDNGDNTWTYTSEDGSTTTIDQKDCFYPPTIPIDASATGSFSIDMHANYMTQYGTPVISSPSAGSIPTFTETELDYHVLDYDNTVINVTSVTDSGMLYYDIIAVPSNNCTYINILFCER